MFVSTVFVPEDANPSNFSVESPTPFSIQLSWVPSVFDCDLKGYAILWRIGDGPRQTLTLDGAETDQVFLDDLTPGQSYSFQIAAETFVRILPFSEIQNVTLSSNTSKSNVLLSTLNLFFLNCPVFFLTC